MLKTLPHKDITDKSKSERCIVYNDDVDIWGNNKDEGGIFLERNFHSYKKNDTAIPFAVSFINEELSVRTAYSS